jgi:subtilisin family serine protease
MFIFRALRALALLLAASVAHAVGVPPVSQPIAGRYIVVLKTDVTSPDVEAAAIAQAHSGRVRRVYRSAIKGFSIELPAAAVAALRSRPNVAFVEQDMTVSLAEVQTPATWGLDRVDQVNLPLDNSYRYTRTGAGVFAFIIDTGIRYGHVEFSGRIGEGFTTVDDGLGAQDCHGHGTHVSGTVGGTTWGVAKQVTIVPVRVFNCYGGTENEQVIAALDWVAASTLRPAVANMSLGGPNSSALNAAVAGTVAKGVTVVVAAGNSNADACDASPASEPSAITVAATADDDSRPSFSNYGSCVDLFAPGVGITSAWNTSTTAIAVLSGTSMASPHVAGAAALVLESDPSAAPAAVASALAALATTGRVSSAGAGSPNLLLFAVTGAPVPGTVAVHAISGVAARAPKGWTATATVSVRSVSTGTPVSGVLVSGSFAPGGSGTCTTGVAGTCSIGVSLGSSLKATQFTATNLAGTNIVYDSGSNLVTQIVIVRH